MITSSQPPNEAATDEGHGPGAILGTSADTTRDPNSIGEKTEEDIEQWGFLTFSTMSAHLYATWSSPLIEMMQEGRIARVGRHRRLGVLQVWSGKESQNRWVTSIVWYELQITKLTLFPHSQ